MANVSYGGTVTQINGSIAGNTFQRNSSGNIARSRCTPTFPISYGRALAQQNLLNLLNLWRALSADAQDEWNAFAVGHTLRNKFGQLKTLSGCSWFKLTNNNRILAGLAPFTNPVDDSLPSSLIITAFDVTTSGIIITVDPENVPRNETLVVYATPPLISQQSKVQSQLRLIKIFRTGDSTLTDLSGNWTSVFQIPFPLPVGSNFSIAVFCYKFKDTSGMPFTGGINCSRMVW